MVEQKGTMVLPHPAGTPQGTAVRQRNPWTTALRQLFQIRAAMGGLIVLVILTALCAAAPLLTPYEYDKISPTEAYNAPSLEHPMGTDKFGRDVLTRILYGGRISLRIGLIATSIGGILGILLGMIAGYSGGWADEGIMRVLDVMLAFPGILLAMSVVAVLGPGLNNLMIAVGIGSVPGFARLTRSAVLSAKSNDYVLAAHALGVRDQRIMWLHILPNITAPIIVFATLNVATAILVGAALNFLGLGAKPPSPEWGIMLSDGRETINRAWWVSLFPGLAIMITSLSINFLGDGLRTVLDPRMRER
jgi:peptide/nickel transport system permease protein